jgi:integrase
VVTAGLARVVEPIPDEVAELRGHLDAAFLITAGWDPRTGVLAPPTDHPLLGFRPCQVHGCAGEAGISDGLCAACRGNFRRSHVGMSEFLAAGPTRTRHYGELICAVSGCPRPARNHRLGVCTAHERERERLNLPLAAFLEHPGLKPRPSFGECRVLACKREAHSRRSGLCKPHETRWRKDRAGQATDLEQWCRSTYPVARSGHELVLHGLSPLVQTQILLGLQERCRQDVRTYLYQLRVLCRQLRGTQCPTILDFDDALVPEHHRVLVFDLQQAVRRVAALPEAEQVKDVWNMAVFGHGRRKVIDFTGIWQPWLREAVKRWVAEELPIRRGDNPVGVLQAHVRCVGELSTSLRLHRDDHGDYPASLGRVDIVAFLNRLKYRQGTGQVSPRGRNKTCQNVALILRECRALGLTRPGQPMAGLPDDFGLRRDDVPQHVREGEPGKALPVCVLNQLIAALPSLEHAAGPTIRVAVELLIDTGRRPTEICKLSWGCLHQDADGKYVLVYTDFKNNRADRRLPITDATAKLITAQQEHVRSRFPDTPVADLVLFPRATRNRDGTRPITDVLLSTAHRKWVGTLKPLRHEDGRELDKAAVFLYAYRHSFAQRHADAGTPVDVLRDLMGHRSMSTTQGYYSITAKRVRTAVDKLATFQFDRNGNRVWRQARSLLESEHQRLVVGRTAVPFGVCTEPSNVKAGGQACPFRFRCVGCGHFRSDPSYLPELRDYLDTLLASKERIRSAIELDDWARTEAMPSDEEIQRIRQLIRRVEDDLAQLDHTDQQRIRQAVDVVRAARQSVHLGMPTIPPPAPDPSLGAPECQLSHPSR